MGKTKINKRGIVNQDMAQHWFTDCQTFVYRPYVHDVERTGLEVKRRSLLTHLAHHANNA